MERKEVRAEDIEPLLESGYRGPEAVWSALQANARTVEQAVRRGWRSRYHADGEELLQEVLVRLVGKIVEARGLPEQPGVEPGAWLFKVVRNETISLYRAADTQKRGGKTHHVSNREDVGDAEGGHRVQSEVLADDRALAEEMVVRKETRERVRSAALEVVEADDFPALARLAFLAFFLPDELVKSHVEQADETVPRGHDPSRTGLTRGLDETWERLCDWRHRHRHDPGSQSSRVELAWILRSADDTTPEHWAAHHPKELRTARDTLSKWDRRARRKIEPVLREVAG